jgi:molybdate transport system permease protein
VLPLTAPSLIAGLGLTWARALGEFGATITFAGNLMGLTQTMPLAVFVSAETDLRSAITLAVILLAVALCVLVALRTLPLPERA